MESVLLFGEKYVTSHLRSESLKYRTIDGAKHSFHPILRFILTFFDSFFDYSLLGAGPPFAHPLHSLPEFSV